MPVLSVEEIGRIEIHVRDFFDTYVRDIHSPLKNEKKCWPRPTTANWLASDFDSRILFQGLGVLAFWLEYTLSFLRPFSDT